MRVLRHLAARARHTGFAVSHNPVLLDQPGFQRGIQRERNSRRVAAGIRNQLLAPDLLAEQLRQAINRFLVQSGIEEGISVPFLILRFALQTEICA